MGKTKWILPSLFLIFFVTSTLSYPLHASCKLTWTWTNISCSAVNKAIINQMLKWKSLDNCDGEKCGYTISSNDTSQIKGVHTTPVKHYKDDLTMDFSGSCTIKGYSTSETWYAVLDDGTNYCNLHNLVIGAGLDKMNNFKETTSDSDCTDYSSANCDKY